MQSEQTNYSYLQEVGSYADQLCPHPVINPIIRRLYLASGDPVWPMVHVGHNTAELKNVSSGVLVCVYTSLDSFLTQLAFIFRAH